MEGSFSRRALLFSLGQGVGHMSIFRDGALGKNENYMEKLNKNRRKLLNMSSVESRTLDTIYAVSPEYKTD
jgi:hypothetical protein